MSDLILTSLYRYPVKSLRGESHSALDVTAQGFRCDRQWMVVDADGQFVTQRQQPRMALVAAQVGEDGSLCLQAPGMPDIRVGPATEQRIVVNVWRDTLQAATVDAEADAWLSAFLQHPCRLVQFAPEAVRPVDPGFARPADQVGFADGFPFLLISQGSLDDLNTRLEQPVSMQRFRPNLVVTGCEPYAEDNWRTIRIGPLSFRVVKPCSRCTIPTVDPETGVAGREPLRTLARYRRWDNKVFFGQNLIHDGPGRLEVGMPVEVIERA